jgi:hypothetical protein
VWLETSSESNVSFHRRLGLEVDGHLVIQGGGPDVWIMARQPVACRVRAAPNSASTGSVRLGTPYRTPTELSIMADSDMNV